MIVARDILPEVKVITGICDDASAFSYLTRAVEILANKQPESGPVWDPLLLYVDLGVQNGYYIFLPDQIEKPIKVNLNDNPAFTRGQSYAFTLNGPGTTDKELGWQWHDKGQRAISTFITVQPQPLEATSDNAADITLSLKARIALVGGGEKWVSVKFDGTPTEDSASDVLEVVKPVTLGNVTLTAAGYPLATYAPSVTYPWYAVIKLSQPCSAVKMLAKRRSYAIASADDVIPLHSSQAVILMCDAIKMQREKAYDLAAQAEALALNYLQEAQKSRNQYLMVASQSETAGARNLSIYNRDSVIVADVYDQAAELFGPMGEINLYDRITTAIEILSNKSQWDPLMGYVDILTDGNNYLTLPRYVESVLALNLSGRPAAFRSKWFEFHLNGPGSYPSWRSCDTWEDAGEVCTAYDLTTPAHLCVACENPEDMESQTVLYGLDDQGMPLADPDGTEGMTLVATVSYFADAITRQKVSTITRIERDATLGFQRLSTTDGIKEQFTLSTYYPDETVPIYQRIRIPTGYAQARIRYRKRWKKVTSLSDPIHLRSRMAIVLTLQGMLRNGTDPQSAQVFYDQAKQLCDEEWSSTHPLETVNLQFDDSVWGGGGIYDWA